MVERQETILHYLFIFFFCVRGLELPLADSVFSNSLASNGTRILHDQVGWNVWGCAPIYDDAGRVHVFFSRWRGNHSNWIISSEIAHAVADHPEGPYVVLGTVLHGRGPGFWDADTIHNPNVQKIGDKYVMTYIGNNLEKGDLNSQKIGIAVADCLDCTWNRISNEPILSTSSNPNRWDEYCVVNPSLVAHPNGQFWLYYRAWDRNNDNMRKIGLAIADKMEGPYIKHPKNPLLDNRKYGPWAQSEDPFVFIYRNKFHCIIKDMGLQNYHSGLYHVSDDGINWSDPQQAWHTSERYFDEPMQRFERPQILMKNGRPDYLFLAFMGGKHISSGAVLKIELPESFLIDSLVQPNPALLPSVPAVPTCSPQIVIQ